MSMVVVGGCIAVDFTRLTGALRPSMRAVAAAWSRPVSLIL